MDTESQMELTPYSEGMDNAIKRAESAGLSVNEEIGKEITQKLEVFFESKEDEEISTPAKVLFSEVVAIAEISRHNYEEELLSQDEINDFFEVFKSFINSFFHV